MSGVLQVVIIQVGAGPSSAGVYWCLLPWRNVGRLQSLALFSFCKLISQA